MKNKILSVKRVFIFSLVIFVIYLATFPKDSSQPNQTMVTLGAISICLIVICGFILLYRLVTKKNQQQKNGKIIQQEYAQSSVGVGLGTTKLPKSSQKQIQKAKDKKVLKAEAQIEKKHNPVRSISYTPPTHEEAQRKDRDHYLKQNFDSKLKTLWRGSKNIEFSYSDANDDISYRNVELNKVAINKYGNIYFSGICDSCDENRTFKTERIISSIECDGNNYSIKQFFTNALQISNNARSIKKSVVNKKETFDIHFTGFKKDDEDRLIKLAKAKDLTIRQSITQNLQVLCIGYNASQTKITQAKNNNIPVMKEDAFLHFLETGEI